MGARLFKCTQRKTTFPHPSAEAIYVDLHDGARCIARLKQDYAEALQLVFWNAEQLCIVFPPKDGLMPLFIP